MNHKERRHLIKQVIEAATSHAKCENLHHKKSHQHLDGWICPAETELEVAIYRVELMLQKGEQDEEFKAKKKENIKLNKEAQALLAFYRKELKKLSIR